MQGYIASVWAVSSVVGPTLGGLFSELASWVWIFWVNVPLGALAAWLLVRHLHETVERTPHRIDVVGGLLLTVGSALVILGLLEGGHAWPWASPQGVGTLGGGAVLLAVFVLVERRAAEPVLPLWVLRRRLLAATAVVAVGVGVLLMGLTTYVPTYLETLLGVSPLTSGLTLAALTLGWPLAASNAGRLFLRIGFRSTVLIGAVVIVVSALALALTSTTPSVLTVGLSCFLMGVGLGLVASPSVIAAQASVEWGDRAVVTGANMFARSMGSALGVAALGAVVNAGLRGRDALEAPEAFGDAVTAAFWVLAAVAVLTALATLGMPRDRGTPARA